MSLENLVPIGILAGVGVIWAILVWRGGGGG